VGRVPSPAVFGFDVDRSSPEATYLQTQNQLQELVGEGARPT